MPLAAAIVVHAAALAALRIAEEHTNACDAARRAAFAQWLDAYDAAMTQCMEDNDFVE